MTEAQTTAPRWRRVDPGVALWLLATLAAWGAHGFRDGLSRDSALYVYAGQHVADGAAPYVEVINRAGPLAQLLPGLGVEVGRLIGLGDIVGVRVVFLALVVASPALTYVLTRDVFGSRLAGSTAAATLLIYPGLALSATDGPQSKQPMMFGLIVALVLLTRRRWLWAGVATGLATLMWQPVVVVLGVVALVMALLSPGDGRSRIRDLARFAVGGALTLALTVAYFALTGSLDAFVEGFWGVNAGYTDQQGLIAGPEHAWDDVTAWLGWTTALLVAGSVLSVVLGLLALRHLDTSGVGRAALGAATLTGLGWSMAAFNGAPDGLLVMPLAATGIGGGVALAVDRFPDSWRRLPTLVVTGWVVVALATTLHLTWTSRAPELDAERAEADALFADLPTDATVFAYDAPQPLALTGRESISRFVLFGEGMKEYVAAQWSDGFRGYVLRVREMAPSVVVTSRRGLAGPLRPLARNYVEVEGGTDWRAFVHEDEDPP